MKSIGRYIQSCYNHIVIEVRNITKTYGDKSNALLALDNINFSIPDGASVAVIGKSGSGKSTLIHIMGGLDRPQSGQVIIDGRDILQLPKNRIDDFRANEVSFVFQSFFVQGDETCYENVSLPLEAQNLKPSERGEKIRHALNVVGLADKINEPASNLSGGQQQRLAIARAIVAEPKILFADEPTGNLDTATGENVMNLLFSYQAMHGATLIIVTHDTELTARCNMQIRLVDGKVTEVIGQNSGENRAQS